MKKTILTLLLVTISLLVSAQSNDKLYKHTGEKLEVKILKVTEWGVVFNYPGETAEQNLGKYAVHKLEYASGRTEIISEKILVNGEDDWEKVIFIEDLKETIGLKRVDDIRGKTSAWGFHTSNTADKKSMRKLKKDAADARACFILMTTDKDNHWTSQSIKRGIAYTYN